MAVIQAESSGEIRGAPMWYEISSNVQGIKPLAGTILLKYND